MIKIDFDSFANGEEITMMDWGNMIVDTENKVLKKHLVGDFRAIDKKVRWICDGNFVPLQIKSYVIPISDKAFDIENIMIEKEFLSMDIGSYMQILKKGYYKKVSDICVINVPV